MSLCLLWVIHASEQVGLIVSGTEKAVRGIGARDRLLWFSGRSGGSMEMYLILLSLKRYKGCVGQLLKQPKRRHSLLPPCIPHWL